MILACHHPSLHFTVRHGTPFNVSTTAHNGYKTISPFNYIVVVLVLPLGPESGCPRAIKDVSSSSSSSSYVRPDDGQGSGPCRASSGGRMFYK